MNEAQNFEFLDILTLIGFALQLSNISGDEKHNRWLKIILRALSNEIINLHNENHIIIKQNEDILYKLTKIEDLIANGINN